MLVSRHDIVATPIMLNLNSAYLSTFSQVNHLLLIFTSPGMSIVEWHRGSLWAFSYHSSRFFPRHPCRSLWKYNVWLRTKIFCDENVVVTWGVSSWSHSCLPMSLDTVRQLTNSWSWSNSFIWLRRHLVSRGLLYLGSRADGHLLCFTSPVHLPPQEDQKYSLPSLLLCLIFLY